MIILAPGCVCRAPSGRWVPLLERVQSSVRFHPLFIIQTPPPGAYASSKNTCVCARPRAGRRDQAFPPRLLDSNSFFVISERRLARHPSPCKAGIVFAAVLVMLATDTQFVTQRGPCVVNKALNVFVSVGQDERRGATRIRPRAACAASNGSLGGPGGGFGRCKFGGFGGFW